MRGIMRIFFYLYLVVIIKSALFGVFVIGSGSMSIFTGGIVKLCVIFLDLEKSEGQNDN